MSDVREIEDWIEEENAGRGGELLEYGVEFRPAIVGMVTRCSFSDVICYDYDTCISILMRQGMSYDDATEYFSFNIEGAYVGERTPMVLRRVPWNVHVPDAIIPLCERDADGENEL